MTLPPPLAQPFIDAGSIEQTLLDAARLAAGARAHATQFGIEDPGDIELPPASSDADPVIVRGAAPLYLAAELESARVLPAVEMLAGVFVTGALSADLGATGPRLRTFWQKRRERLTASERDALFGRAFGKRYGPDLALPTSGRNVDFETSMLDLTEALSQLVDDRAFGGVPPLREIAVSTAAESLATSVTHHARGMASIAAVELIASITEALAILKEPAVQHMVGARSAWGAVRMLSQRYLDQQVDVDAHVTRGRSGMSILMWLADAVPRLGGGATSILRPGDPVIVLGIQWMQATLRLEERTTAFGHHEGAERPRDLLLRPAREV